MLFSSLINSAKFEMNLLRKFILPKNDYNSLMFLGWVMVNIASILAESILIPSLDIICPKSLPSSRWKNVYILVRKLQMNNEWFLVWVGRRFFGPSHCFWRASGIFVSMRSSLGLPHCRPVPRKNRVSCMLSGCYMSNSECAWYGCAPSDLGVGDRMTLAWLSCTEGIRMRICGARDLVTKNCN